MPFLDIHYYIRYPNDPKQQILNLHQSLVKTRLIEYNMISYISSVTIPISKRRSFNM